MKKFGFNAHSDSDFSAIIPVYDPPVVLVFSATPGGNLYPIASLLHARERGEFTGEIVYRPWYLRYRTPTADLDDFSRWLIDDSAMGGKMVDHADSFFEPLRPVIRRFGNNILYHTFNETGFREAPIVYKGLDTNLWRMFIRYHTQLVGQANDLGLRLVTMNLPPGNPGSDWDDGVRMWEVAHELELFKALAAGGSVIGHHAYFAEGNGWEIDWILKRHEMIYEAADNTGNARPDVIITEYGAAGSFTPKYSHLKGWKDLLDAGVWTARELATLIVNHHERIYDKDPNCIGTCWFIMGGIGSSAEWETFEFLDLPEVTVDAIESNLEDRDDDMPLLDPCKKPFHAFRLPAPYTQALVTVVEDGLRLRTRPIVDDCSDTGDRLYEDEQLIVDITAVNDGYKWAGFKLQGEDDYMWLALSDIKNENVYARFEENVNPSIADTVDVSWIVEVKELPVYNSILGDGTPQTVFTKGQTILTDGMVDFEGDRWRRVKYRPEDGMPDGYVGYIRQMFDITGSQKRTVKLAAPLATYTMITRDPVWAFTFRQLAEQSNGKVSVSFE